MDRNISAAEHFDATPQSLSARRAWIEMPLAGRIIVGAVSLSARRAWIEMANVGAVNLPELVALRKESVDRNYAPIYTETPVTVSLSARRAWIEISCVGISGASHKSLSARRAWIEIV